MQAAVHDDGGGAGGGGKGANAATEWPQPQKILDHALGFILVHFFDEVPPCKRQQNITFFQSILTFD